MTIPSLLEEARNVLDDVFDYYHAGQIEAVAKALLAAEQRGREMERARADDLEDTLWRVKQWCRAYPIAIFPEPDFKRARELLEAGGITLDAVSASNMRHVCNGIAEMIDPAIRSRSEEPKP